MQLSIDTGLEERIIRVFFDRLPKEFEEILGEIKKKTKGRCKTIKSDKRGAFGIVKITRNKVIKILDLIPKNKQNMLLRTHKKGSKTSDLYFLLNRLNNYCEDISIFIKKTKKFFPNNFLKVFNCSLCIKNNIGNNVPSAYVEMDVGRGVTFKEFIENPRTLKRDVHSIIVQVYYISLVLNMNKLYHNDLKPANIIISKSTDVITYKGLKNKTIGLNKKHIMMELPKGNYYPIIIDYDLTTQKISRTADVDGFLSPTTPDFSFFGTTTSRVSPRFNKLIDILPDFSNIKELKNSIDKINEVFNKYNKVMKIL